MARATLTDLASLGLPTEALRTIPTVQAPVTATGAGTGWALPAGAIDVGRTLVGSYAVRVEIRTTGGAPGVAGFRFSLDDGATWSADATTPARGHTAPLGHTGLLVGFEGTFSVGDLFTWTATSAAVRALSWASGEMDDLLAARYPNGLVAPYPEALIGHECGMAAWKALGNRGWNPENPADKAVVATKNDAYKWAADVVARIRHPALVEASPSAPLLPLSDPLRLTAASDADDFTDFL